MAKYLKIAYKEFMGVDDLVGFLMTNTIRDDGLRLTDIKIREVDGQANTYSVSCQNDNGIENSIDILKRYGFHMTSVVGS